MKRSELVAVIEGLLAEQDGVSSSTDAQEEFASDLADRLEEEFGLIDEEDDEEEEEEL